MDKPLGWGRDESGLLMQMAALAELFERWPTLKRWLDEGQGDAVLLDRLRAAARLWDSSDRAADMLWRGKMADEARGFRERYRGELPVREQLFLEEVLRLAKDKRRRRRRLVTAVIAALSLLVLSAMAHVMMIQKIQEYEDKEVQRDEAEAARREAEEASKRAEYEATLAREAEEAARQNNGQELEQCTSTEARVRAEIDAKHARVAAAKARDDEARAKKAVERAQQSKRQWKELNDWNWIWGER